MYTKQETAHSITLHHRVCLPRIPLLHNQLCRRGKHEGNSFANAKHIRSLFDTLIKGA